MTGNGKERLDDAAGAGTSDKIEGKVKETKGRVKEAAGDLTGNDSLKREGAGDKVEGKVQHAVGEVKQGAEDLLDKAKHALPKH